MAISWKHHILLTVGFCESLRILIGSISLSHSQWPRQHPLFDVHIKYEYKQTETEYTSPHQHISQVNFSIIHNYQARKNVSLVSAYSGSY